MRLLVAKKAGVPSPSPPFFSRVLAPLPLPRFCLLRRLLFVLSNLATYFLQDTPPKYNASAIEVPVALYWGGNDWLADPDDVKVLMKILPKKWYDKYLEVWEHLDFIWGLDAAPLVYDDIAKKIIKMENGLESP